MSRSKKSRTGGPAADVIVVRNRTQSDVEGRERKRDKKRKGLKTGSRNAETKQTKQQHSAQQRDPRLGSKKKIPLIVTEVKKPTKAERRVSAAQELEMLENDAQLLVLLDRIEDGENLGSGLQKYVDEKLNRIEMLMKQLGLYEEDIADDVDDEEEEMPVPATKKVAKKSNSDEDLLSEFESFDFDQFKG
ncbi:Der GTPase-activating protein YihI [Vibrio renipiscarius]|uniref:Der GTPase-activating protein YihI n=1 Tax=Vibrio renipiscarius TaxID=1461322 RepID=A0A0C2KJC7_9VIBR|nr:Der GTPase-activating protein YihI [Vibrio renipiscarius]KII78676.1 aminotransferase [Vibrio renipiscarius]KII82443.1 aminotransferase [Vibrio renipiscarius]